jgi:biotin carboxyl carrier protein
VNRSVLIAAVILAVIVSYFGIRSLMRGSLGSEMAPAAAEGPAPAPDAIVVTAQSQPHSLTVRAKGRTAPDKSVTVKSGTAGTVISTPVREGNFVKQGTLLCGVDVEARSARVKEAEANRNAAKVDFDAAASLAAKGLTPANREAAARATLDAAEAAVNSAKVELGRTQIRAPFDGIFERRLAEAGDYLSPGSPCGLLVDLSPVIVSAEVTEAEAGLLQPGMMANAARRWPHLPGQAALCRPHRQRADAHLPHRGRTRLRRRNRCRRCLGHAERARRRTARDPRRALAADIVRLRTTWRAAGECRQYSFLRADPRDRRNAGRRLGHRLAGTVDTGRHRPGLSQ